MAFFERLIGLVAPHTCLVCDLEGEILCEACAKQAVMTKQATCYRCNRLSQQGRTCRSCRSSSSLSGVTIAAYYDGVIKLLIHQLKYDRARAAAQVLAQLLTPLLAEHQFDLVTAVPTDPTRRRVRGYNQAELLGRAIALQLDLPYVDTLLRTKAVHQIGAERSQRLRQIRGAFLPYHQLFIKDAQVLIIDDVVTTGATLAECAATLKQAGATRVWGGAIAKH